MEAFCSGVWGLSSIRRHFFPLATCKKVALSRAVEADDAVVHGTKRSAYRLLAVRLEAVDPHVFDVHCAASWYLLLVVQSLGTTERLQRNRARRTPLSMGAHKRHQVDFSRGVCCRCGASITPGTLPARLRFKTFRAGVLAWRCAHSRHLAQHSRVRLPARQRRLRAHDSGQHGSRVRPLPMLQALCQSSRKASRQFVLRHSHTTSLWREDKTGPNLKSRRRMFKVNNLSRVGHVINVIGAEQ